MIKPIQICELPAIKGYDLRKRVYSVYGAAPTIRPCEDGNNEPKIMISAPNTLDIRNGNGHIIARIGDGVKLIFPTGTESAGRVRRAIAPTIMTAAVVGVVVYEN